MPSSSIRRFYQVGEDEIIVEQFANKEWYAADSMLPRRRFGGHTQFSAIARLISHMALEKLEQKIEEG